MATNADDTKADDIDQNVSDEEAIRKIKEDSTEVETPNGEDETDEDDDSEDASGDTGDEDGQTDDDTNDDDSEEDSNDDSDDEPTEYVKEFPNIKGDTLPDYTRNLEEAYKQSTSEALRLKKELDDKPSDTTTDTKTGDDTKDAAPEIDLTNPVMLYAKQQMDREITETYEVFSKDFPQVREPAEYDKFTRTVAQLSSTILNSEKRMATPKELYSKAAVILGWEPQTAPTDKEKLGMSLKGTAAVSKTSSATKKVAKSKVTDAMVATSRKMYPGKSDADIRKELEPYVQ